MSKHSKKATISDIYGTFPTISQFEKCISVSIDSPKKEVMKILPKIPSYLKELHCPSNPFLVIKSLSTQDLKSADKNRKNFDKEFRSYPVHKNVNRDIRIRFHAKQEINKLKFVYDQEEQSTNKSIENLTMKKMGIPTIKHSTNINFIIDKRRICILELSIKKKEQKIIDLEKIVEIHENFIRIKNERLRNEQMKENEYLKMVCEKTSRMTYLADKHTHLKNVVTEKLKNSLFKKSKLIAEFVALEVEYMKSKSYKTFLSNCHEHRQDTGLRNSRFLMDEIQMDSIIKELDLQIIPSDKDSDEENKLIYHQKERSKFNKSHNNNLNNSGRFPVYDNNNFQDFLVNRNNTSIERKFDKLKSNIFLGYNNVEESRRFSEMLDQDSPTVSFYDTDTEESSLSENIMFFQHPQELIDIVSELEINSLSLIENLQDQEKLCDTILKKTQTIKEEIEKTVQFIDDHIKREENKLNNIHISLDHLSLKEKNLQEINDVQRFKTMFNFGEMKIETFDEFIQFLSENVSSIYQEIFINMNTTDTDLIDMLGQLESIVDDLYLKLKLHNVGEIRKARKKMDEDNILALRLEKTELLRLNAESRLQKTMKKANMPPRHKYGRKVIYRSKPLKHGLKVIKCIKESLSQEENTFFFT